MSRIAVKGLISSAFDLLLIFLCSLTQTLTLTPPPNNALLANMDMYGEIRMACYAYSHFTVHYIKKVQLHEPLWTPNSEWRFVLCLQLHCVPRMPLLIISLSCDGRYDYEYADLDTMNVAILCESCDVHVNNTV